jgi:predicted CoA-substrate-specific enzyme activase
MAAGSRCTAIGVDIGSTTWKGVGVDSSGELLVHHVEPTDPRIEQQTDRLLQELRGAAGGDASVPVGATGYGRKRVPGADRVLTEITCHARGAYHLVRRPGVLIDFGGQDTKVIRIGPGGEVLDFRMNDKCAAGTGRFLEVILGRLGVALEEAPELVARASGEVPVSSTCTVFAESEVISLVAQGEPLEDIVVGLHRALSTRVAALAGRLDGGTELFMSGGVALNRAMTDALSATLGREITVLPHPQLVGALGAALAVTGSRQ